MLPGLPVEDRAEVQQGPAQAHAAGGLRGEGDDMRLSEKAKELVLQGMSGQISASGIKIEVALDHVERTVKLTVNAVDAEGTPLVMLSEPVTLADGCSITLTHLERALTFSLVT
jgi:hypothetical protein